MKNKLVNVSEAMGLSKQTPMAIFLRELGIESEIKMNWRLKTWSQKQLSSRGLTKLAYIFI